MPGSNTLKSILVVDDEPLIREFLTEILSRKRYRVEAAADGEDALSMVKKDRFALVLTDWRMRGRDGISLLRAAREVSPDTRFVIMTAYATVENAVEAMKLGACDYLTKPFSGEQVEQLVERILMDGGAEEGNPWRAAKGGPERRVLVGGSPKMKEVQSLIRLAASTEATVLITGETGTGKELVAQAVHEQSRRGGRSFVRFNCAALPETLFESELFGHERGAFTGAIRQRRGRFELAHGGTLLMDEISEMAWGGQAKLLRVLQEKEFERVGGAATLRADVRVIATTNKDLAREIREERFRSDLYYRLSVFPIAVPPLRDRLGDIPDLTRHFLRLQCRRNSLEPREISPEALDLLMRYSWPGNVRELENCLERVAILSRAAVIGPECFYDLIGEQNPGEGEREGYWIPAGTSLKDVESAFLIRTLEEVGGNRSLAASRLGISSRTLRNKLHMMGRMDFLKSTPQREVAAEGMERKNVPPGMERSSSSGFRMQ